MGPDGGIARIRVYGTIVPDINALRTKYASSGELLDLAAVEVGGVAVACSNKHYGHPRNLIVPGRGNCMADGWETARQPNRPPVYVRQEDGLMHLPGCDWSIIKLGNNMSCLVIT
jgi:allantoicase